SCAPRRGPGRAGGRRNEAAEAASAAIIPRRTPSRDRKAANPGRKSGGAPSEHRRLSLDASPPDLRPGFASLRDVGLVLQLRDQIGKLLASRVAVGAEFLFLVGDPHEPVLLLVERRDEPLAQRLLARAVAQRAEVLAYPLLLRVDLVALLLQSRE